VDTQGFIAGADKLTVFVRSKSVIFGELLLQGILTYESGVRMLVPFVSEKVGLGLPGFNTRENFLFEAEFDRAYYSCRMWRSDS